MKKLSNSTLLIGFDSAWTARNSGALVGALRDADGQYSDLGPPHIANFRQAQEVILDWQATLAPTSTIVMLDQPCIVQNPSGQRPVEHIVGSSVSLRYGGMQPASTSRHDMFGTDAPVWTFLAQFGGAANPLDPVRQMSVFETYPVLALIAWKWMVPDARVTGRLPKYNPERRKTFSISEWQHVCQHVSGLLAERRCVAITRWLDEISKKIQPRKSDQDGLDASICLLVAMHFIEGKRCLMVGDAQTGYIIVPMWPSLKSELELRCDRIGRVPSEWVRAVPLHDAGEFARQFDEAVEKPHSPASQQRAG